MSRDLASRTLASDQQAEAELIERYKRVVMSIIRREVGDTASSSDVRLSR
jgi:hypothetical protein